MMGSRGELSRKQTRPVGFPDKVALGTITREADDGANLPRTILMSAASVPLIATVLAQSTRPTSDAAAPMR